MARASEGARTPASQRGSLVVEALVAVAVFSIGLLGVVAQEAQSSGRIDEARYRGEAMNLAQSLLAQMSSEDPSSLAARYDSGTAGDAYAAFAQLAARLPGGQREGFAPTVRVLAGPSAASRTVAITLRWQRPGSTDPHFYTTTAVFGRN